MAKELTESEKKKGLSNQRLGERLAGSGRSAKIKTKLRIQQLKILEDAHF